MVYSYDPLYFREVTPLVRCSNDVSLLVVVQGRVQIVLNHQFIEDKLQVLNVVFMKCDGKGVMLSQIV